MEDKIKVPHFDGSRFSIDGQVHPMAGYSLSRSCATCSKCHIDEPITDELVCVVSGLDTSVLCVCDNWNGMVIGDI